jgi:hypothetical protein
MKMYTKESISNHCMYDYFEKGFVYIVGVKQQPHNHSILESWNYVHLYTDGNDMINKVHEIQPIVGINPDCSEYAAAGMLAGIRI